MITITRRQARRLRGVFRRSALGIAHRGPVPPVVFSVVGDQLCARHRYAGLAVEHAWACRGPSSGAVALPLDALADFEAGDDSVVSLDPASPERTVARWSDRGIPRAREYVVAPIGTVGTIPGPPESWTEVSPDIIDALAGATATAAEDDTRYTLSCILLKAGPNGHEVVATDGRQVLIRGGFRLPWADDVLVRRSPVFACRELPRDRPWSAGRTETHVVLRCGPWALWLEAQADLRFPRVDMAFPAPDAATARLRLDPADAAFLIDSLGRLPGADTPNAPVTVDLNGRVAVRARGEGDGPATELVLSRSGYSGTPVRFQTNREFLGRAARLGFPGLEVVDPASPIVCRDGPRAYAWQPLDADSAIGPSDDAVRIESEPHPAPAVPAGGPRREEADMSESPDPDGRAAGSHNQSGGPAAPEVAAPSGLAALIGEAEALHEALGQARSRAGRLVIALRKQKRRERLVASTLASLRQLRLQDVAE